MIKRFYIFVLLVVSVSQWSSAAERSDSLPADTTVEKPKNLVGKIIDYFNNSNQTKPQKDVDISFIGGPHYSSDTKFGIGVVAAGVYRHDKTDTITQPSNVSIYFDATTSMFFKLGVRGTHFYPGDRMRWSYDVNFASISTKFWGIGYDAAINDDNESKYKYLTSRAETEFVWRILPNFYAGPKIAFDYVNGRDFEKPELWLDEADRTFNLGAGLTIKYDSRDNITATTHGTFIAIDQQFNPRFLANKYAFSLTEHRHSTRYGAVRSSPLICMPALLTATPPGDCCRLLGAATQCAVTSKAATATRTKLTPASNCVSIYGEGTAWWPGLEQVRSFRVFPTYV